MRKHLVGLVVLVTSFTTGVAAGGRPYDSVQGAYWMGSVHGDVTAHETPRGPQGKVAMTLGGGGRVFEGEVTCVRATANHAAIEVRVTQAEPSFLEGQYLHFFYEDNGPSNDASRDRVAMLPWTSVASLGCFDPELFMLLLSQPIERGNIVVLDAFAQR